MLDPRLLRALDRVRARVGIDRGRDPRTGRLIGALTGREAIAAGWATVGPHTYGSFTVHAGPGDRAALRIGAYTSIAEGVEFALGGNHRADWVSTYPFRVAFGLPGAHEDGHPRPERDIVVGSDVWLGHDALVLPGATISDGAVVGARAVVAKEVRPYAVVVGSPAREVAGASRTSRWRRCCASAGGSGPRTSSTNTSPSSRAAMSTGFIAAHDL